MSQKIIADLGIAKSMVAFLEAKGMEVLRIVDINPGMSDTDILDLAFQTNAILLTADKDFGDLIFYSQKVHSGVLLLRIEDATSEEFLKIITFIFENHWEQIPNNFCVFKKGKFRIRG
jgi:predicted nuclease of predicted toxin-antitoxin system